MGFIRKVRLHEMVMVLMIYRMVLGMVVSRTVWGVAAGRRGGVGWPWGGMGTCG